MSVDEIREAATGQSHSPLRATPRTPPFTLRWESIRGFWAEQHMFQEDLSICCVGKDSIEEEAEAEKSSKRLLRGSTQVT